MKDDDDDGDDDNDGNETDKKQQCVKFVLISGNVGSLFENVSDLMTQWIDEIAAVLDREHAKFIAIHLQEVGGKNYTSGMPYVKMFREHLTGHRSFADFDRWLMLTDEDFGAHEHFTALGNLYFVHKHIGNVAIWDFQAQKFHPVTKKVTVAGQIEDSPLKEKSKFPQHFSPQGKCSRKGFMRTRWSIEGHEIDFVNVHLFHDISNFVAMESFPSAYSSNRSQALGFILNRLTSPHPLPLFIFGDFNFRLDTKRFIAEITRSSVRESTINSQIHYYDSNNDPVLILGQKTFICNQRTMFLENAQQLQQYDREPQQFQPQLHEHPLTFPPSYPFEETVDRPTEYMTTRCPAWCDRILFNTDAKRLLETTPHSIAYNLIGLGKCMGDHKPVYCGFEVPIQHLKGFHLL